MIRNAEHNDNIFEILRYHGNDTLTSDWSKVRFYLILSNIKIYNGILMDVKCIGADVNNVFLKFETILFGNKENGINYLDNCIIVYVFVQKTRCPMDKLNANLVLENIGSGDILKCKKKLFVLNQNHR